MASLSKDQAFPVDFTSPQQFSQPGSGQLVVQVNPGDSVSGNGTPQNSLTIPTNTQVALPLNLYFWAINPPASFPSNCNPGVDCFVAPESPAEFVTSGGKFLQGLYPVAVVNGIDALGQHAGSSDNSGSDDPDNGEYKDVQFLRRENFLQFLNFNSGFTRTIGLVDPTYFDFHHQQVNGVNFDTVYYFGNQVSLVASGAYRDVPHELGHSFSLCYSSPSACATNDGTAIHYSGDDSIFGYWTELGVPDGDRPRAISKSDPNQPANPFLASFMTNGTRQIFAEDMALWWMDPSTYTQLYGKFTLQSAKSFISLNGQSALLVTGTYSKDGTFQPDSSLSGAPSSIEAPVAGAGEVVLLDPTGAQIAQASFDATMGIEAEGNGTSALIPVNRVPVAVVMPFPSTAATVQVNVSGIPVASYSPHASLLQSAIEAIPSLGYVGNPTTDKTRLLDFVSQIQVLLNGKFYVSATNELQNSLSPLVVQLVSNSFIKTSPLDFNQADVLNVINQVLATIPSLNAISPSATNGVLSLQIDRSSYLAGQSANIKAMALTTPVDSNLEYLVKLTANGLPLNFPRQSASTWAGRSGTLSLGAVSLKATLFLQDKKKAESIERSIGEIAKRITALTIALIGEKDPDKILKLKSEISQSEQDIRSLKAFLEKGRTQMGSGVALSFNVQ